MQPRRPFARWSGVLAALAIPAAAFAVQLDYQVDMGLEHNDNVNLSEDDPVSANILEPALGFTVQQDGSTVQASANGIVQYRDYLGGEFSDEFRGQLAGHLNWTLAPQRLNLTVDDSLSVQPVNPLQPNTPINQQQINVFSVGPTLDFRFGDTVRGEADVRYINSHADETAEFNTNRALGAVRAIKDLDATSAISANVVDEHVDFTENDAGPNYDRYSVFGRYTRNWTSRVDLIADLGYSWLRYSGNQVSDRNDPLGRATVNFHPSDRSTFSADFAYQISDAASGLLASTAVGNVSGTVTPIPTAVGVGDINTTSLAYLERRLGVGYAFRDARLAFNVNPYYRKLDYGTNGITIQTGLDESARGATAGVSYLLRPLISIGLTGTGENLRYDTIAREDKTWTITASLRQQWTRNWSWRFELTHYERNSDAPGQSNNQNIAYVGLAYTR